MSSGFLTLQSAWFTRLRKILLLLCGKKISPISLGFALEKGQYETSETSMRHILFLEWERKLRRELCRYRWINLIRCLKVRTYVKGVSNPKSCLFILLDLVLEKHDSFLYQKAQKYLRKSYKAHVNRSHVRDFRKFEARKYFQRIALPFLLTAGWKLSFSQCEIENSQLSKFPHALIV